MVRNIICWKRIMKHMHQYARRIWSVSLPAFFAIVFGGIQVLVFLDGKCYQGLVLYILGCLAFISFIIGIIALTYDTETTFRQHHLLKISQHLQDYLADMKRLNHDFEIEQNHKRMENLLEVFRTLHTKIEWFIKHELPNELEYWNESLTGQSILLGIAIKESIRRLEDIISKNRISSINNQHHYL